MEEINPYHVKDREHRGRDTILIVDDIEVNRIILQSIFERDYNLLEAENGEQAMVLLKQYHGNIAAVLLDLVMPQKDGYQVLAEMNDLHLLPECPVIIITSEDSPDNTVKAFDLGVSDIVMKPFEPVVVKRRVENSIALSRNQQDLQERIDEQAARLMESNAVMIDALSAIIEYRSVETGQHIQRIRMFTRILLEEELEMKREDMIWSDRKRNWLGLPWTFTVYGLTEDRLFIKTGVLNIHEDEVRLYRILDLSLRRSFWQRIVGLGTIHVDSSDKTMKAFDIHNIRDCENVKEQLSGLVEQERDNKRVSSREFIGGYEDGDDGFDEPDGHY